MIGDWNRKEKPLLGLQGSGGGLGYIAGRVSEVADLLYTISNSGVLFTLRSSGTVNYTVDWGDGSNEETSTSNDLAHTYSSSGTYKVKINSNSGFYYRPKFDNSGDEDQITSIAVGFEDSVGFFNNIERAFRGAQNMTEYTQVSAATSDVADFERTWENCSGLTEFPLIDTSSGTNFTNAWLGCTGLTTFPLIDTSSATNCFATWYDCSGLTSFPTIDTSNVTDFGRAWRGCSGLTSFPLIDTSNGTDMSQSWRYCSGITTFPQIDTSSGTTFSYTWQSCSGLTEFPLINTSSGTNFTNTWRGCTGITTFPSLDFSSATRLDYAWMSCQSLTTYPANQFDTTGTLISNAFHNSLRSCALTAQSIENILTSLDTNGAQNITLHIGGGTNAGKSTWSTAANTAYNNLITKGWTISYNS